MSEEKKEKDYIEEKIKGLQAELDELKAKDKQIKKLNAEIDSIKKNISTEKASEKSKPLIIFGFLISLSSIFLLLFTINNRFG